MEILYRIALLKIGGVGSIIARLLVDYFGSAKKIFEAPREELEIIPGIGKTLLQNLSDKQVKQNVLGLAYKEYEWYSKNKIRVIAHDEEDFPELLKDCHDAPFLLYLLGNLKNTSRNVAIVGSRKCSHYGQQVIQELCEGLTDFNVNIISGLAYGIDTLAHQEALKAKLPTTAVLAHGLDRIYPAKNRKLAKQIAEYGALLSDYPIGTNPDRENFPKRNRIVAGMSVATIVVEAAASGGALITADIADSYGREVFAIPGKINDNFSKGCNNLIRYRKAQILTSVDHLISELNWGGDTTKAQKKVKKENNLAQLNGDEKMIAELLISKGNLSQQLIALHLKIPIQKVGATLFSMELSGQVKNLPGNVYEFIP